MGPKLRSIKISSNNKITPLKLIRGIKEVNSIGSNL